MVTDANAKASGENGFPVAASLRDAEVRVSERLGYKVVGKIVSAARLISFRMSHVAKQGSLSYLGDSEGEVPLLTLLG